ncbi:hypothetical protein MGALJ_24230 [Mycobacterium gallinarum]|uniref:Uncharacterized protein n=1 Tax=Mycobacterium gallinarum TaxID=39689 RepID=A0A9W4FFB0_9MYCO|nr:hypothetical protein [Mycobacterium gallinarum]BBY92754.1 hypothetical protein MGALJ_24230 [Mycobacterium gallinarum]
MGSAQSFVQRVGTAVVATTALATLMTGCGEDDRVTAESVYNKCKQDSSNIELSEDKKAIEYNFFAGTESAEAVYECLLKETHAPSNVDYQVKETRPIDGTQNADWEGWKMLWTYEGRGDGTRIHLSQA